MNERLKTMDLHALLRRLRAGETDRAIARHLAIDRKTVRKYRLWAEAQGLLTGELPDLAGLHALAQTTLDQTPLPPQNQSGLEPYRAEIETLLQQGLGPYLIYAKFSERPEFTASASALWRFVRQLRPPQAPTAVGRLETLPGDVAQIDFGEVTRLIDPATGTLRRTWALVMVLAWSRHTPHLRWGQVCTSSSFSISPCRPGYAATSTPSSSLAECRTRSCWTI